MTWSIGLSLFASLTALWGWTQHSLMLTPDFYLYTQGGLGLYPSPIGRFLGSFGETPFVVLSIAAIGTIVFLVSRSSGVLGAAAIVASPVLLYLSYVTIDGIALAFFTAAIVGIRPGWMFAAAAFTHFSLIPFVALEVIRSSRITVLQKATIAFFVVPTVILVLLVTPYGGVVAGLFDGAFPLAFLQGLAAGIIIGAPALLLFKLQRHSIIAFLIGAFECGIQGHLQARYMIPAVVILAAASPARSWTLNLGRNLASVGSLLR